MAWGLPLSNIAAGVLAALLAYLAMSLALRVALSRARKVAERTDNRIDDMLVEVLGGTQRAFLALAAVLIGLGLLDLPERWNARVSHLWFIALAVQFGLWLTRAVAIALRRYHERSGAAAGAPVGASATLLSWALRTLLWATVLLAVLSNLGINITAFVASLGVGGIAIALAVQNILGDLFASLSIAVDKPFEAGDFIGVGAIVGTVQYIGLKTTRIRSLSGEQIIISNTDLLKQVVQNYRRMEERRIVFRFGLDYDADVDRLEAVPGIVRGIIEGREKLRFDRAHLQGFGESRLEFEVVYIVKDPSYNVYMDEQQQINLQLMRALAEIGLRFALPARRLHIEAATAATPDRSQPPLLRKTAATILPNVDRAV